MTTLSGWYEGARDCIMNVLAASQSAPLPLNLMGPLPASAEGCLWALPSLELHLQQNHIHSNMQLDVNQILESVIALLWKVEFQEKQIKKQKLLMTASLYVQPQLHENVRFSIIYNTIDACE